MEKKGWPVNCLLSTGAWQASVNIPSTWSSFTYVYLNSPIWIKANTWEGFLYLNWKNPTLLQNLNLDLEDPASPVFSNEKNRMSLNRGCNTLSLPIIPLESQVLFFGMFLGVQSYLQTRLVSTLNHLGMAVGSLKFQSLQRDWLWYSLNAWRRGKNERPAGCTYNVYILLKTYIAPEKMDVWNTTVVSFWGPAYFQVQTCC